MTSVAFGRPEGGLSYREARQAPCLECPTSPCCTYLLLANIEFGSLLDVDYAQYLLNFDGIYLNLGASGRSVQVYLYQACSNLDEPSGLCQVHSTPLQPAVCVNYKSQTCGYRKTLTVDLHPKYPLLDRARMDWFVERMVFDDDRKVVDVPGREELLEAFAQMPLERRPAPATGSAAGEWRPVSLAPGPAAERPMKGYGDSEVSDPCTSCDAWCCRVLEFDRGLPENASEMDSLWYALGFPSVELRVGPSSWAIVVHTTCRHLEGSRCAAYGSDERPLRCGYYDALNCDYRPHYGVAQPPWSVRVSREQFGLLADSLVFDNLGAVLAIPPIELLRDRLGSARPAPAEVVDPSRADAARGENPSDPDSHPATREEDPAT